MLAALRDGSRLLLAAFEGEALIGAVQLALEPRANGRHRAEVMKLMVLRSHRGRGIGGAPMQTLVEAARASGRTLLLLDVRADDPAERLYQARGFVPFGRVPDHARSPDGRLAATSFHYLSLAAEDGAPGPWAPRSYRRRHATSVPTSPLCAKGSAGALRTARPSGGSARSSGTSPLTPSYSLLEVAMPTLCHKTTILLSEPLHRRLTKLARERGQSLGQLVRQACERQYGMTDQRTRLAAVEALGAMRLPAGPIEQMVAESAADPRDLPD